MYLTETKFVPGNPNIKTHVFWPVTETMKFINYNDRQWPNPGLLSFRHSEMFSDIEGQLFRNIKERRIYFKKDICPSNSKQNQNYQNESYLTQ